MHVFRVVVLASALLFWNAVAAQESPPDYQAQRLELAASPDYNPYALQLIHEALLEQHYQLSQDPAMGISEINEPLAQLEEMYPLGIQVNYAVAGFLDYVVSLETEGDVDQTDIDAIAGLAEARRQKAWDILDSILSSGDGESPDTAFVVINIIEEYAVMDHFEMTFSSQSLTHQGEKTYDRIVAMAEDGSEHVIFFDISAFHRE